jgi:hypothetical protein
MSLIRGLREDVSKYLRTPEGLESIILSKESSIHYLHSDKLFHELESIIRSSSRIESTALENKWIAVPDEFSKFYMTLLATKLSEEYGLGLLTGSAISNRLANAAKLDGNLFETRLPASDRSFEYRDRYMDLHEQHRSQHQIPRDLAEGTLVDFIFKDLQIDPSTSLDKILAFRDENTDELGRFRENVGLLTEGISNNKSLNAMNQQMEDIYKNKIKPELSLLKKGLKRQKIKQGVENFLKVSLLSTTSSGLLLLLGLSSPYILLATSSISIIGAGILYNVEKRETLDKNPYSYLLSVERTFGNNRIKNF